MCVLHISDSKYAYHFLFLFKILSINLFMAKNFTAFEEKDIKFCKRINRVVNIDFSRRCQTICRKKQLDGTSVDRPVFVKTKSVRLS